MKNFKLILTLTLIFGCFGLYAQVGIGTQTPSAKSILDLTSTNKGFLLPRMTTTERETIFPNGTTDKGMIVFDTTTNSIWYWIGGNWVNTGLVKDTTDDAFVNNTTGTRVELGTKSNGAVRDAGTEFVIQDAGNVGIGTSNPAQKFHIESNSSVLARLMNTNATANSGSYLLFGSGLASNWARIGMTSTTATNTRFGVFNQSSEDEFFTVITDGASMGNVGIGTTAPTYKLDVRADNTGSQNVAQFVNVNVGGTEAVVGIGGGSGSWSKLVSYNNRLGFRNYSTNAEVMTVNVSNGNVGIGTTNPDSSAMLDINSTTKGFKLPTMNWTQIQAIVSPASGLRVYSTTHNANLTNTGTPSSPIWVAEVTSPVTSDPSLPIGTIRVTSGLRSNINSVTLDEITVSNEIIGGNHMPIIRTSTNNTLVCWASSEWSTSSGSEHSVGSYAVANGGQWTRNNYSFSTTTGTGFNLHSGLSASVQNMLSNETNEFTILDANNNRFYKVVFYNYSLSGADRVVITITKLK
jgi:hypothetical protein